MKEYLKIAKPGDFVVMGLILVITIGIYVDYRNRLIHGGTELLIEVHIAGGLVLSEPLKTDVPPYTISIPLQRDGEAILSVEEGTVRALPMPLHLCPDRICSDVFGRISSPGENIICVPNLMIVELVGTGEPGLDGVTR